MNRAKIASRVSTAILLAAGFSGAVLAAQPVAPRPAGAATPVAPKAAAGAKKPGAAAVVAKDIWDQDPYPLYADKGRVDPFTRGKRITDKSPDQNLAPGPELDQLLGKSLRAYAEAEALLSSDGKERFEACAGGCRKGMQELRQTMADIAKNEELIKYVEPARALMERFQRLESTAERLKQRQAIEAEFAGLKLAVDGIVWNEHSPSAAVNGRVVGEGRLLNVGAAGQDVQVYRIRRNSVVFLYKGVQISVMLDRGGL